MYCREHLIFASAMTGQKTICPHCNRETILLPSIKPPSSAQIKPVVEPEKPLLQDPNWPNRAPDGLKLPLKVLDKTLEAGVSFFQGAMMLVGIVIFIIVALRALHAAWGY